MAEAALWGFVGGGSLLLGSLLGLRFSFSSRTIGLVMAFGAGVLLSAAAFELTEEAFRRGGRDAAGLGVALGALAFFAGDGLVDRLGGEHRKRSGDQQQGAAAGPLVLGTLMDGIPESAAIGISLLEGTGVGVAVAAAVFISNVPESLSASVGLRRAGHSRPRIVGLWVLVTGASVLASVLGFVLLDGAPDDLVGGIQAFAAGAIVVMLADTMIPEAYAERGRLVGIVTAAGFVLSFLLSTFE